VRCHECKDAPTEQHNYCECCGRPLPAQTAVPSEKPAAEPHVARCESCGAPSGDMDLCPACQEAFQSVLETKKNAEAAPPAQDPIADIFEAALEQAKTAPLARPVFAEPEAPSAQPIVASAPPIVPLPSAHVELPKPSSPAVFEPAPQPALKPLQQVRSAPVERKPARTSAPQPVVPPARPAGNATRTVGISLATVVIAAAIGIPLGQHFATRQAATAAAEPQPANVPAAQATAGERRPTQPPPAPKPEPAPAFVETPPPAPKRAAAPSRPAPVKASRTPRQPNPSTAASVPVTPPAAVVAEVLPAAEPVAPPPPAPAPAAPVGPFFQVNQVNQPPQVVSRVEPAVPADVQGAVNDVVIVKVLVSQAGEAAIVSLVRRSRSGPALDDAVVEAVKQWTFAPAKKRGEAVSCWFHVGVPVVRAD
jgi:TonB family protein